MQSGEAEGDADTGCEGEEFCSQLGETRCDEETGMVEECIDSGEACYSWDQEFCDTGEVCVAGVCEASER